jgi:DNA-binding MarR family transcriptional regulator
VGQAFADDLGFLVARAGGVLVRATNAALAEHGLRVRQYSVLALAAEAADGLSQRELGAVLGLDPSQVVSFVDDLVEAGLVERRTSPTDRRAKLVVATATGRQVRAAAGRDADAALEGPLALLGETERDHLRDMLTRVWTAGG